MRQTELGGAFWLVLGELAKIVAKAVNRTAIKSRPERWFANRGTAGQCHVDVIIRDAADHVGMRFDVAHRNPQPSTFLYAPVAPLPGALATGFVVGSLKASRTRFAFCRLLRLSS